MIVSAGRSGGWIFGGLGLGLLVIMLESRHRKWQGASVSDLGWVVLRAYHEPSTRSGRIWGVFCATVSVGPSTGLRTILRRAQDERTGGLGCVLGREFRPLAPLGVTEGGSESQAVSVRDLGGRFDGLTTILQRAQHESGGCFVRPYVCLSTRFRTVLRRGSG